MIQYFLFGFGICFHAGCRRVESTYRIFYEPYIGGRFAQIAVFNVSIRKVDPDPFINLF